MNRVPIEFPCPFHYMRTLLEVGSLQPGSLNLCSLTEHNHDGALILDFPASRTVRFLMFISYPVGSICYSNPKGLRYTLSLFQKLLQKPYIVFAAPNPLNFYLAPHDSLHSSQAGLSFTKYIELFPSLHFCSFLHQEDFGQVLHSHSGLNSGEAFPDHPL